MLPMVSGVQKLHNELLDSYSEKELGTIADFLTRFTANVKLQAESMEGQ